MFYTGGIFTLWYCFPRRRTDMIFVTGGYSTMVFVPSPWNLCWMEICHSGGRFAIWHYSPLWKFCYGISSGGGGGGEGLPCGIISGGTICHGVCSLIMKFVWGEIYHRGGNFTIW